MRSTRYGCSEMSSRNRMPPSIAGSTAFPTGARPSRGCRPTACLRSPRARDRRARAHFVLARAEHREAMLERVLARELGAEVIGRHRPGVGDHAGARQRGELERGEVRMTEPARLAARERLEVDAMQQARQAVAAADRHGDVDVVPRGHSAMAASRSSSSPAKRWWHACAGLVLDDAMTGGEQGRVARSTAASSTTTPDGA